MSEFIPLSQALEDGKGNFIAKVIAVSDIKEGAKDGRAWKKQTATLKDNTAEVKITMWNEDVNMLTLNKTYQFESLMWKEYQGKNQPQTGKYTQIQLVDDMTLSNTSSHDVAVPESIPGDIPKLPEFPEDICKIIQMRAVELLQIEDNVVKILEQYRPREVNNGQKIGMMTRTIFSYLHDAKVNMG